MKCNTPKLVGQYIGTSYDILFEIYKNTGFFKDLYDSLNPAYYVDFSAGLDGWAATEGTGELTSLGNFALSVGGDFFKNGFNFPAEKNKFFSLLFDTNYVGTFVGDLEVTYDGNRVVRYVGVIAQQSNTSAAIINLDQREEHTGNITGIRFILGSTEDDIFNLFRVFIGKPLLATSSVLELEAGLLDLNERVTVLENGFANLDSRVNTQEEKPELVIDEASLEEEVVRYKVDGIKINDVTKKLLFRNDAIELLNSDNSSYFKYDLNSGSFIYKGILILSDGTQINGIEDIRAQDGADGDYQEFRFTRSATQPSLTNTDPNPSGFTLAPPEGELPIWFIVAKKASDGSLLSTWSMPAKLSGSDGSSGTSPDVIFAYLTSENYIAISDANGANPNLSAAGGEFVITKNGVKVTSGVTYSGGVTKNGLSLILNPTNGLFNLTGASWNSDVEFFDLTATYEGKSYVKRYSVIKNKNGSGGGGGTNTLTLLLYKSTVRAATSLAGPTGPVTFNTSNLSLTENTTDALNGWSLLMPEDTLPKRWVVQAIISTSSSTIQIQPSQWSTARVLSIDGVNGEDGGGSGGTGVDGFSRATVYAYKAANTIASNDTPGDTLYTFSTGSAALGNGWQSSIPESLLPVWVRTGLAISRTATDTINSNEWADAVKITGASVNTAQLFIYKRTSSATPPDVNDKPSTSASYNFETGLLTGLNNDWFNVPPLSSGKYLWIRVAMALSTSLTDNIAPTEWSEPRLLASDGSDGSGGIGEAYPGAERKGATYPSFNWNATGTDSATTRWGTLAGRSPVAGDVFIQVNSSTGATEVRAYNGTAWVAPAAVYESLVTFGVLSGDQILAGSVINAPVIRGGSVELTGNSASQYMTIIRNDSFGPNNLVEWFGPKINGVTWNPSTNAPIYSGMTMSNARTYKTLNGSVFFGGTFRAGTLSNSLTSTTLTSTPSREITFSSNGGSINIAGSVTYGWDERSFSATTCPPAGAAPTLTVFIEQLVGGAWQIRSQQSFTGYYFCEPSPGAGEPRTISKGVGGSITFFDSANSTSNRTYRVRGVIGANYSTNENTYVAATITTTE